MALNRLKKSPRNARKVPHGEAAIEALAGSIAAKGMLQMPVVEPEFDPAGEFTGSYIVTIGEGRRLAQLLRVKRKEIKKTEAVRCRVDTTNDPHEISLDENVTRTGIHALVLRSFYVGEGAATCLEIRTVLTFLPTHAPGIEESKAGRAIAERHDTWARQIPADIGDAWAFVVGLNFDSRMSLLAHCASLSVNAVQTWERRPRVQAHADTLAQAVSLDMTAYWPPTTASYLGRVTKARIAEAVSEGVSPEAAERIKPLKKGGMADEAEQLLNGTGWLPVLLRKPEPTSGEGSPRL